MKKDDEKFLLRLRERDTQFGVTRGTLANLAKALGVNETDAIHRVLAESARKHIPQYEQDEGPLTDAQDRRIDLMVRREHGRSTVTAHLFDTPSGGPQGEPRKAVRAARPR